MIWLWTSIASALLLGVYDIVKKGALKGNGVLEILCVSTGISALFFVPLILSSIFGWGLADGTILEMPAGNWQGHVVIMVKSLLVAASWITGYLALKFLPLTTVSIIKASRPVFVLLGCMLFFGERLNAVQWVGMLLAFLALYLLGRTSRKDEGIDLKTNKWAFLMAASVLFGVISALFDKAIMIRQEPVFVQAWCDLYVTVIMALSLLLFGAWQRRRGESRTPFRWDWNILLISVFITFADFFYFYSLSCEGSMLSVVSMLRRSSVVITFLGGAVIFKEQNLQRKGLDMILLLCGMAILLFGSY